MREGRALQAELVRGGMSETADFEQLRQRGGGDRLTMSPGAAGCKQIYSCRGALEVPYFAP